MKLIRLQNMVPEVYPNNSRDFQLFCRLYDCVFNGNKFDIDSILDICDTEYIDSKLLRLLQSKLGFLTDADISDDELRYILKAFPYMVKWKGSKKAIEHAVYVFLKLNHIKTNVRVTVSNNIPSEGTYSVEIGMETAYRDTTILTEMLKYLMPTGYKISYLFYHLLSYSNGFIEDSVTGVKNAVKVSFVVNSMNSSVRRDFVWVEDNGYDDSGFSLSENKRPWNTFVGESVTSVYNEDIRKSWHKGDTNKWYAAGAVDTQAVYSNGARTTENDTDIINISPTQDWIDLMDSIKSGTYATDYSVGDTITIPLTDNTSMEAQIVAFDQDKDKNGNSVPVTFISKYAQFGPVKFNDAQSPSNPPYTIGTGAVGGWKHSYLRQYVQSTVKDLLPDYVKYSIIPVRKVSSTKFADGTFGKDDETFDDVWVPSSTEANLSHIDTKDSDYQKYQYGFFTDNQSRIKNNSQSEQSPSKWSLRTVYYYSSFNANSYAYRVKEDGTSGSYAIADSSQSRTNVAIGFCVGYSSGPVDISPIVKEDLEGNTNE